ncbi:MAG: hypothetical protein HS128_16375 [Ideonella sp.]|nr:hypothetical protein [Ideonella sp.]
MWARDDLVRGRRCTFARTCASWLTASTMAIARRRDRIVMAPHAGGIFMRLTIRPLRALAAA